MLSGRCRHTSVPRSYITVRQQTPAPSRRSLPAWIRSVHRGCPHTLGIGFPSLPPLALGGLQHFRRIRVATRSGVTDFHDEVGTRAATLAMRRVRNEEPECERPALLGRHRGPLAQRGIPGLTPLSWPGGRRQDVRDNEKECWTSSGTRITTWSAGPASAVAELLVHGHQGSVPRAASRSPSTAKVGTAKVHRSGMGMRPHLSRLLRGQPGHPPASRSPSPAIADDDVPGLRTDRVPLPCCTGEGAPDPRASERLPAPRSRRF